MDEPIVGSIVGSGCYGKVYLTETAHGICATKRMDPSSDGITRDTARELHALFLMGDLEWIVQVIEVHCDLTRSGNTLISIDFDHYTSDLYKFIKTVDLRQRLECVNSIVLPMLHGLHALFQRGIIHRDIKPENILVQYQYDTRNNKLIGPISCVIADFGISRQLLCTHDQDETKMTAMVYSPWYRPPELLEVLTNEKVYSYNADVWAMGATIAEYYTGVPLFGVEKYTNQKIAECIRTSLKPDGRCVDITSFFKKHLRRHHLSTIPNRDIVKIETMLTYDRKLRPNINKLIDNQIIVSPSVPPLSRGRLQIDNDSYQKLVMKIFDASIEYQLEPVTVINAIGILERYLTNCQPKDHQIIPLISVIAVSLSVLINEMKALTMTDYYEMANGEYEIHVIKQAQIIIASKIQYCFSTCEADVFMMTILDQPKPSSALRETYQGLFSNGQNPQLMSYYDLAAAVTKYS